MQVIPKGQSSAPSQQPNRPVVQVNTGTDKSAIAQKLDAIKQRFSGSSQNTPTPINKQGGAIPSQPSGARISGENPLANLASQALDKANTGSLSTSETIPQAEAKKSETSSPQMQLLARQQQALRKAQLELKAGQDAWKQEQAKYLSKEALTSDPLKALAEAGISQDRLVELQLNQSQPPSDTEQLKQKIAELEQKLNGVDETFKSRDKQAYDQAVAAIERDAKLLVNSDPAYETIKALGPEGTKEVVELIKKQFALDGTILDVEDAAKQIEELALEREYDRVNKLMQLQKIKQKMAPPVPAAQVTEAEKTKQPQASQPSPSLTNKMAVQRPLTARERAILAFQEAGKKS